MPPSRSLEPLEEALQTQLHRLVNPNFYGYQDAPWRIFLRKEVPGPAEAQGGATGGREEGRGTRTWSALGGGVRARARGPGGLPPAVSRGWRQV